MADATVDDAKAALGAAHETFAQWRDTPPRERGDVLRRAYDVITERADDLALLMTLEMGKPVAESKAEIAYAANFFRWYAEEAVRINGRFTVNEAGAGRVLTLKQPVGPCVFITPWNFPLAMGTRKIGPAIAAGCTMVVKPAKQTPLSMLMLAQILEEVGLPGGVVNVITARSSGRTMEPLIKDPRTRKLSFTGSTEVGRTLIQQSADQVLRVSMELGGNAPFLVFDDADVDAAVEGALIAKMRNGGEACTSANRFHVADGVAKEFAEKLASKMGEMKVGRGTEPDVKVGPLIDDDQRGKVAELVDDARERGAKVLVGGSRLDGAGYFYEPTVLADVPDDARLLGEEIFGPVAPVKGFSSDEEAIAAANDTEYGLVAYVYTQDINRAFKVIEGLDTGMIGLNQGMVSNAGAPFGGRQAVGLRPRGRPRGHPGVPGDQVRGDERPVVPRFVDLSAPIEPSPPELPDLLRTDIEYSGHAEGAKTIEAMLGVGPELLRDGEGWAVETFLRFGTHNSTHVDAPWHYNSTVAGKRAQTIDELPLEWFHAPGVVLDFSAREDGDAIDADDVRDELARVGHTLAPLDIVLVRTDRDAFYAELDYMARGPGVTAEATRWLFEQGVRVMGIDAWGWDRPLHLQAQEANERREAGIFWAAHQADLPYSQIERLANLGALPSTGFRVSCFPLRIVGASAAPARVVAILDD